MFINVVSNSTLQFTFKKLPLELNFGVVSKKNIDNYLIKL